MLSLVMQVADALAWVAANWLALVAMLAVASMAGAFLFFGLSSTDLEDPGAPDESASEQSRDEPPAPPRALR